LKILASTVAEIAYLSIAVIQPPTFVVETTVMRTMPRGPAAKRKAQR
jgi:hypothetical protein